MKLSQLVDDLELRLTKGKPSDDFEIPRSQMEHWIIIARDAISKKKIEQEYQFEKDLSNYTKLIPRQKVICTNDYSDQRKYYIPMELELFSFAGFNGIEMIVTSAREMVARFDEDEWDWLRHLDMAKPSRKNLMYDFVDKKVFIHGLTDLMAKEIDFTLRVVPSDLTELDSGSDEDKDIAIDPSIVAAVLEEAEIIGVRELGQGIFDDGNDGTI